MPQHALPIDPPPGYSYSRSYEPPPDYCSATQSPPLYEEQHNHAPSIYVDPNADLSVTSQIGATNATATYDRLFQYLGSWRRSRLMQLGHERFLPNQRTPLLGNRHRLVSRPPARARIRYLLCQIPIPTFPRKGLRNVAQWLLIIFIGLTTFYAIWCGLQYLVAIIGRGITAFSSTVCHLSTKLASVTSRVYHSMVHFLFEFGHQCKALYGALIAWLAKLVNAAP
jgi:hypothetical protein